MNTDYQLHREFMWDEKRNPEDEFNVLETIGKGSFGAVYVAEHKSTHTKVALKKLTIVQDSDEQSIFGEIEIMKESESPYIVTYYGYYFKKQASEIWIFMEYCEGRSISDMIAKVKHPLSEDQMAIVCEATLKGLDYLHNQKKVHRDIKPDNILVNTKGEAKLADFGVTGQLSPNKTKMETVIGTPFFLAPEIILAEKGYTTKVDIWSLGISILQMAEMEVPYADANPMRAIFLITENASPVFAEPTKWSKELNDFLSKCLTKNPDERPSAKDELAHPWIHQKRDASVLIDLLDEYKDRKSTRKSGTKKKSKTPTATESDLANATPDASLTSSSDITLETKPKKKKKVKKTSTEETITEEPVQEEIIQEEIVDEVTTTTKKEKKPKKERKSKLPEQLEEEIPAPEPEPEPEPEQEIVSKEDKKDKKDKKKKKEKEKDSHDNETHEEEPHKKGFFSSLFKSKRSHATSEKKKQEEEEGKKMVADRMAKLMALENERLQKEKEEVMKRRKSKSTKDKEKHQKELEKEAQLHQQQLQQQQQQQQKHDTPQKDNLTGSNGNSNGNSTTSNNTTTVSSTTNNNPTSPASNNSNNLNGNNNPTSPTNNADKIGLSSSIPQTGLNISQFPKISLDRKGSSPELNATRPPEKSRDRSSTSATVTSKPISNPSSSVYGSFKKEPEKEKSADDSKLFRKPSDRKLVDDSDRKKKKNEDVEIPRQHHPSAAPCGKCGLPVSGGVEALGKKWHDKCFVCTTCSKPLTGSFLYDTETMMPYCIEDYNKKFGKKCAACSKIIEGTFVKALGNEYHDSCFKCTKCKGSLAEGFFDIEGKTYCEKCANKK